MFTLILTLFLGAPGNLVPVTNEIIFQTLQECEKAKSTAAFTTELPVVGATAVCEKRNAT